jgi:CRP-like cAMP-binding protein
MTGVNLPYEMPKPRPAHPPPRPPGQADSGAYVPTMGPHASAATAACPDCPATRLEVFEPLVLNGGCRFRGLALAARRPIPGAWFSTYRMGLVRRGVLIRQRVDRQGRVTAVDAAGPGCMFLLGDPGEAAPASMVSGYAATDARVCLCSRTTMDEALKGADVCGDLIRMQEAALDRVERFADARGRPSAEARIAAVLVTLADTLSPPRQRDRIPADFQQRDVARLAGLRHETVCRLLGNLEGRGVVQRDREGLLIGDREALETL